MKAQIRLGNIRGIEIGLHYSWLIIALLISLSLSAYFGEAHPDWDKSVIWLMAVATAALFFVAIVLHELSHAAVARAHGLPVRSITLFALGGVAEIEKESPNARTEFWLGIVGPITSAVIGAACLGGARLLGWAFWQEPETPVMAMLVWLGYINLSLAVFNMIPGFPMDGGRVFRAVVWLITSDPVRSTRIASVSGQAMAFAFIVFGLLVFFSGRGIGGLWIAFIGWFLLNAAKATYMQVEVTEGLRGAVVRDLMSGDCPVLDGNTDLKTVVEEYLMKSGRRCFMVTEGGAFAGLITPHEIKNFDRAIWAFKTASDAMLPAATLHVVAPETPVLEALETLGREEVNQLPVVMDGRLVGVISREQIINYLFTRRELGA